MRHLTVYQRLAMIIAVLSVAFFAVSVVQILVLRDAVLNERRTTVRNLVEAAIEAVRDATGLTVDAIREIGTTISHMNEITNAIAAAVEEQGAATQEIARNVQQASQGTQDVLQNILGVREASGQVGTASGKLLTAAEQLSGQSEELKSATGKFLTSIRAA